MYQPIQEIEFKCPLRMPIMLDRDGHTNLIEEDDFDKST